MARKRCCGLVENTPFCLRFTAEGQSGRMPVVLAVEELEAIRLKDFEGLDQSESAALMGLSRATYQRVLGAARSKVAGALVNGHTIVVKGGNYIMKNRVFECGDCGFTWEEAPCGEGGKHGHEIACPRCGSKSKYKVDGEQKTFCSGGGQGPGHGHCCGRG